MSNFRDIQLADGQDRKAKLGKDVEGIMTANDLVYKLEPNLSVIQKRNIKPYFWQNPSYSAGNVMVIEVQTGSQYVKLNNSFIKFDLVSSSNSGTAAEWGEGSVANIFQDIVVLTKGGQELMRTNNINNFIYHNVPYTEDAGFRTDGMGTMMGYGAGADSLVSGAAQTFIMPLRLFGGLFENSQLAASYLMSGLRIEITLAPAVQAIKWADALVNAEKTYTVSNLSLNLDTYLLTDQIASKLQRMAAQNSLEHVYQAIYNTRDVVTTGDANSQIAKAVSRALKVIAVCRLNDTIASAILDSFASETLVADSKGVDTWQYQVGALYFPHRNVDGPKDTYVQSLYSHDKLCCKDAPNVDFDEFLTDKSIMTATLETQSLIKSSGISINSSRTIQFQAHFEDAIPARTIDYYLIHEAVLRQFVNNAVLKI